jgi:hypothetical protein
MKTSLFVSAASVLTTVLFGASFALANPATLPVHPGYPMGKAVDPVKGQSLANDPGQKNAVGDKALNEAAKADVGHVSQDLSINRNDKRIVEKSGAGLLPKVEGPNIVIAPPVKEATKMNAAPK